MIGKIKSWMALCGSGLGGLILMFTAQPSQASGFESAILAEINFARTQPFDYAQILRRRARLGEAYEAPTAAGATDAEDLAEAIAFLERQAPLAPLQADERLAAAGRAHVEAQGSLGSVGHGEADGTAFETRLHRAGVWAGLAGEDISYGRKSSRGVVTQLIIDSGVPGRGHRTNLFDGAFDHAGVACGPHRTYGVMCVIDLAGALMQR